MITLTENPVLVECYLEELSTDIDSSCQEMRVTVLGPLRNCARLLQPFHATQRGRDLLAILNQIIYCVEQMIIHWEIKSGEITKILHGEREYKPYEGPIGK